jgi:hypothetical protein
VDRTGNAPVGRTDLLARGAVSYRTRTVFLSASVKVPVRSRMRGTRFDIRRVLRPGGKLIAPTFCHDQTLGSAVVSRLLSLTLFPSHRRFTTASLRSALESAGLRVVTEETLGGLIPIGYVDGVFA